MKKSSPFLRLGRITYRFRIAIIAFWMLTTILLGFFAIKLPSILSGSGFEMEGSFSKVENILQERFNQPKSSVMLIFDSKSYEAQDDTYKQFVNNTLKSMEDVEDAVGIESPYEAPDKMIKDNVSFASIQFDKSLNDLKKSIDQIRDRLPKDHDITVSLTGGPVIAEDMNTASQQDLARAEAIGIPAALLILLLAFGGLVAAGLPIIVGLISVASSLGLLYFYGQEANVSIFLLNVVPMIGLALGIDFALLLVNRFREELHKGVEKATVISVQTAGRSIAFSGLCVFLGLSGMLLIDIDIFKTVAIGGMVVVVLSVLIAITFLPALLAILGKRINALKILKIKENDRSIWYSFASFVMKRPVIMALFAASLLIFSVTPVKDMKLSIPEAEALPPDYESRTAFEKFEKTFGEDELYPVLVVAESEKSFLKDKEAFLSLERLIRDLEGQKEIAKTDSFFDYTDQLKSNELFQFLQTEQGKQQLSPALDPFVNDRTAVVRAYLSVDVTGKDAKQFVKEWEREYEGLSLTIGGSTKFNQEIFDEIIEKAPYGLAVVLAATLFILMIAFRSVFIPIKAIIMNMLSLSATFGMIVWIFQSGIMMEPVDIGLMIPVFTFGIVFGLSMDYEVFLISRIQEMYEETGNNDHATLKGLTSTSKIITSAAAIMIVITGSFAFTDVMPVKQIGIAIALAILIDATIVRMIFVPSLMKLLGHWNWWMPFSKRRKPHKQRSTLL
ncbi:MMPL family transporter [Fictibacillus phosphorivorans]|uniref:MMPL family transporter n=1 Tax=Fictibacillus phosphorivorans TaxID=1221500 RepID=UPI00203B6C2F|nr:MMPL family transporter [Fictibacillus phosphorivorans]MCM3719644.1 MMPL family transporter [Fictibacillus phosphorivorans]MCM3777282.1 MMPL family transporter [Fictibacillus phosphorivorans]